MAATVGINVVFTDLVGSTELSSRLGPEATEELRVTHFGLLRSAMEQHGGSEVKNLGDGLMLVFPSLGSALDGAVAMQQAIERHNSSGKEPLGVRVGVATGDATEEDDDYFGEPVVEAARLCAKCEAGQIIVSELLSMIARSTDHTFRPLGDLELRGVPEPVPSVSVDWEPLEVEAVLPVPDRLIKDMDRELAGRRQERDALTQALKEAEADSHRVTFLAGEPGIGKTRLSSELAAEAFGHGSLTLYGRCDEELSLPYQPWVEAIGYLFENGSEEMLAEVIEKHGPELAAMVPQIRRRFPDIEPSPSTDAETERYMLLQAVTGLLGLISSDNAVLLVLDDLHWADKPSLTMLRHVFTNLTKASLMIIGTYRDSDLEAGHPLIDTVAALRREPGVEQLLVRGLDDQEMMSLVEISAGHALDETATALALALRRETAGNPFFAHEILRNLVESGDLVLGDDDRWAMKKTFEELTLPQSVRDVVGQRVARLGEDSVKALRAAAVIGKEFDLELLAQVTGSDEDDLLDLLEQAMEAGILAEVPGGEERFRFLHTVARSTLQGELSDGRKRRMHRKIAEALEASIGHEPGGRAAELATHWLAAAAPVEEAKAIKYARMAGRQALDSLAPDEAIRWFGTALEHLDLTDEPEEQVRAELLVELGTAQQQAGDPEFRQTLLDAGAMAEGLGETQLMVGAALANNRGLYSKLGERDEERIGALQTALKAIGEDRTAERALLLATLFSELESASTYDQRMDLIGEAIDIAREVGDQWVLSSVLNRSCTCSLAPQNLDARVDASAESLTIAESLGDQTLKFWASCGAFYANFAAGDFDAAAKHHSVISSLADEVGTPSLRWVAGLVHGALLSGLGKVDEYEQVATSTFAVGSEAGEPDAFDYFATALMNIRWLQGRSMEVTDQLLAAGAENPEMPVYTAVAACLLAEDGDTDQTDQSRALLRDGQDAGFEIRVNNTWSLYVLAYGLTAAELGDAEAAAMLYDLYAPWCGQVVGIQSMINGSVDGVLGALATTLGRHDEAEAHFVAAEVLTSKNETLFFATRDDLYRARLHRDRGDPDQARHYGERAVAVAGEHGYESVERRAQALLEGLAAA